MIDQEIDIQTKNGVMNTFVTHPEEDGPHPIILFLMDAPGKREELHDMARRLGSSGYQTSITEGSANSKFRMLLVKKCAAIWIL